MMYVQHLLLLFSAFTRLALCGNEFVLPAGFAPATGSNYTINWGNKTGTRVAIDLVTYFSNGPVTAVDVIAPLVSNLPNSGSFVWFVSNKIDPGQYNFQIEADNDETTDTYSKEFDLTAGAGQPGATTSGVPASTNIVYFGNDPTQTANSLAAASGQSQSTAAGGSGSAATGTGTASAATNGAANPSSSDSATASQTSSISTGAIVGIVIGVVAAIVLAVVVTLLLMRRRRQNRTRSASNRPPPMQEQQPQYTPTPPATQHQQYPQPQSQPLAQHPSPLNQHHLDQHLAATAGDEWSGIRPAVRQQQTATVVQSVPDEYEHDRLSYLPELRPDDAADEPNRFNNRQSAIYSEAGRTALHPASEAMWRHGV